MIVLLFFDQQMRLASAMPWKLDKSRRRAIKFGRSISKFGFSQPDSQRGM
jgi:hypothetical protein